MSYLTLRAESRNRPNRRPLGVVTATSPASNTTNTSPPRRSPNTPKSPNLDRDRDRTASLQSSTSSEEDAGWIPTFLQRKGNDLFVEVNVNFICDTFNLTGLDSTLSHFHDALDVILDQEVDIDSDSEHEVVQNEAEVLYGLIHARYIITKQGLAEMRRRFQRRHFAACPRYLCEAQSTLPLGISDEPHRDSVKLFCPRCEEVYRPVQARHEMIDGAFFGTTFPHLFFVTFPELKPRRTQSMYIPKVFGFKLHKSWHHRAIQGAKAKEAEKEEIHRLREQQQKRMAVMAQEQLYREIKL